MKSALVLGAAVIFLMMRARLKPTPDAWMLGATNNPDRFFIWTTNGSSYSHTFTYDPHAADDWLREFVGQTAGVSNAPP